MAAAQILTTVGKGLATAKLVLATATAPYIDWGTSGTTATVADTALGAAAGESRTLGTASQQTTTVTNDTYQVTGTMTATAGRSILEVGTFDATTAGNMFVHATFGTAYVLNTNDQITFKVQVQLT